MLDDILKTWAAAIRPCGKPLSQERVCCQRMNCWSSPKEQEAVRMRLTKEREISLH